MLSCSCWNPQFSAGLAHACFVSKTVAWKSHRFLDCPWFLLFHLGFFFKSIWNTLRVEKKRISALSSKCRWNTRAGKQARLVIAHGKALYLPGRGARGVDSKPPSPKPANLLSSWQHCVSLCQLPALDGLLGSRLLCIQRLSDLLAFPRHMVRSVLAYRLEGLLHAVCILLRPSTWNAMKKKDIVGRSLFGRRVKGAPFSWYVVFGSAGTVERSTENSDVSKPWATNRNEGKRLVG